MIGFGKKVFIVKPKKLFDMNYISPEIKENTIRAQKYYKETMEETNYDSLYLGNFEEYNQITFFVPNYKEEWTFEELTDKFI